MSRPAARISILRRLVIRQVDSPGVLPAREFSGERRMVDVVPANARGDVFELAVYRIRRQAISFFFAYGDFKTRLCCLQKRIAQEQCFIKHPRPIACPREMTVSQNFSSDQTGRQIARPIDDWPVISGRGRLRCSLPLGGSGFDDRRLLSAAARVELVSPFISSG